jgi:hypothetical protein
MQPWQTLEGSALHLEPDQAVQLCRSLRYRGAYVYYAAADTQDEQVGAAAIIKYRMTTSMVKQQAIAETSTCSLHRAKLAAILYAIQYSTDTLRKTAHTTSREALPTIEKGHTVGCGRGVVHKVADAVPRWRASTIR